MKKVYISNYKRTPIGNLGGALKSFSAIDLGVIAVQHSLKDVDKNRIEEVLMGNVLSANLGQAPARQVTIRSGLDESIPATTINKVCASGMKVATIAAASILSGKRNTILVGGMESMSNAPYYAASNRFGKKYGHDQIIDGMLKDGLWDPYENIHMGTAAEQTNTSFKITREEQDRVAVRSFRLANEAFERTFFSDEIVSIETKHGKLDHDERMSKVDESKVPLLKPTFSAEGSITPANASGLNDGAASMIISSDESFFIDGHLAEIVDFEDAATKPIDFSIAPHLAIKKLLDRNNLKVQDIDLFEINEAYANTVIANAKLLNIPIDKVNTNGGAVALGHPIGMSGTRILGTLARNLKDQNKEWGIAAICNGGGGASAVLIRNTK